MTTTRCHWWDAERKRWWCCPPEDLGKPYPVGCEELEPEEHCPYCGAALPVTGQHGGEEQQRPLPAGDQLPDPRQLCFHDAQASP